MTGTVRRKMIFGILLLAFFSLPAGVAGQQRIPDMTARELLSAYLESGGGGPRAAALKQALWGAVGLDDVRGNELRGLTVAQLRRDDLEVWQTIGLVRLLTRVGQGFPEHSRRTEAGLRVLAQGDIGSAMVVADLLYEFEPSVQSAMIPVLVLQLADDERTLAQAQTIAGGVWRTGTEGRDALRAAYENEDLGRWPRVVVGNLIG